MEQIVIDESQTGGTPNVQHDYSLDVHQPFEPDPPCLFNPFNDGKEPAYLRIETANGVTYKHASAGSVVQGAGQGEPLWQRMRKENIDKYDGCSWGRWGTKTEWEDAYWMANSKSSQAALDELLQTERVSKYHKYGRIHTDKTDIISMPRTRQSSNRQGVCSTPLTRSSVRSLDPSGSTWRLVSPKPREIVQFSSIGTSEKWVTTFLGLLASPARWHSGRLSISTKTVFGSTAKSTQAITGISARYVIRSSHQASN